MTYTLSAMLAAHVMGVALLFARISLAIMLMPGIGDGTVSARMRVILIFFLSLLLYPLCASKMPAVPSSLFQLAIYIAAECFTGFFLGLVAKIIVSVSHMLGAVVSMQAGFSSAMLFDPTQGEQAAILSSFFGVTVLTLMFAMDLHHLYIKAVVQSVEIFPIGQFWLMGDQAEYVTHLLSDGFAVAIKLAAPQLLVGLLLFSVAGIMARLMPSMQIFFIILPLQITLSVGVLMVTLMGLMVWYQEYIMEALGRFVLA